VAVVKPVIFQRFFWDGGWVQRLFCGACRGIGCVCVCVCVCVTAGREDKESADHPAFAYGAGCPLGGRREEKGKKRVGTFRSAEGVESEESKPKKTKIFPRPCVFSCPSYI
jgi:hypothetical protein